MSTLISALIIASAAIYQCDVNGVTTYSPDPCDDTSEPIELNHTNTVTRQTVNIADYDTKKQGVTDYINNQRRDIRIKELQAKINDVRKDRDFRINNLRNHKRFAANNLAGATWEQSLSEEMTAISIQADSEIKRYQAEIDNLRKN